MTTYSIAWALVQPAYGALSDRYGPIALVRWAWRVAFVGAVVSAIGSIVVAIALAQR